MNIVFVGGGSLRLLPIIRGIFKHHKGIFKSGEIRLVDLDVSRAELVGKMIMKTPEYQQVSTCRICWSCDLDEMLKGADILYVTMAIGSRLNFMKGEQACRKLGFIGSDQLSPLGAVLSLIGGTVILNFARKMEQHCPNAQMLIFANPVAVYSAIVNNHTNIKALGICGGYANHSYDLTRIIFGKDERREGYDINVAGVNHCSLILSGTYNNADIFGLLKKSLTPGWKPPETCSPLLKFVLYKLVEMYKRFDSIVFSTEPDGFAHLFHEECLNKFQELSGWSVKTEAELKAEVTKEKLAIQAVYDEYRKNIKENLDDEFWNRSFEQDQYFGLNDIDVSLPILKAIAGLGTEKIVASQPNNGAVAGFKERTVLEYSILLNEDGAIPAGRFEIPDVYHGLMSSLATHQTLLADAIAACNPKILAEAFYSYPILQNYRSSRQVFSELMNIFAGEYPEELKKVELFLQ